MLITILEALIAIPKIGALIKSILDQVLSWYIAIQTRETLRAIADAAAISARAETHEERFKAAELWRITLSRGRMSK